MAGLTAKYSGLSRANQNKAIRQEALREQLSAQGHVQHVIDIADQLSDLNQELDPTQVARLKATADIKLKLIGKYLPDLKQQEVTIHQEQEITDIQDVRSKLEQLETGLTIDVTPTEIK